MVIYFNEIDWNKFLSFSAFSDWRLQSEAQIKYSVFEDLPLKWQFWAVSD